MQIPLTKPFLSQAVKDQVNQVLDSGFWTEGATTKALEERIGDYLDAQSTLAVCNCTVGLEIALRALGVSSGDEVIVPDYTYPATAAAALLTGANVTLVDVDPTTMLVNYQALEAAITPKTKAIIPVSLFGNPLDYNELHRLRDKYGFAIVEDAACALGARFQDKFVGTLADITVFSLHPRKFITTGEGGIITTDNKQWAEWMDRYKHFGISREATTPENLFTMVGGNYKLSNLQAAVGLAQMTMVQELLAERRKMATRYQTLLDGMPGITLPKTTANCEHSYQTFTVFVDDRNQLMQRVREHGVEVQIGTYSLHMQPAFRNHPRCRQAGELTGSTFAFNHCLALPLYPGMNEEEQDTVINTLRKASGAQPCVA
ncbi:MAG: DegT/DnrJ/EryC1/StrS family aminotransferase [Desulfobulbaceae bacterium]|nr:DegT/DnrJ/EryC1/StrS family aminotransferase [Desulfobulbaceae bacterium]